MAVRYFDVSNSWKPSSPKLNTWSTICCVVTFIVSMSAATSFFSSSTRGGPGGVGVPCGPGAPPRPRCAEVPTARAKLRTTVKHAVLVLMMDSPDPPALPTLSLRLVRRPRAGAGRRRGAVVDAVEQQLERSMRLRAPVHFVAEQHHVSLAGRRFDDRHRLIEVLLAPRPTAAQRRRTLVPRDRLGALQGRFRLQPERRALVVKHHGVLVHAVRQRVGVV